MSSQRAEASRMSFGRQVVSEESQVKSRPDSGHCPLCLPLVSFAPEPLHRIDRGSASSMLPMLAQVETSTSAANAISTISGFPQLGAQLRVAALADDHCDQAVLQLRTIRVRELGCVRTQVTPEHGVHPLESVFSRLTHHAPPFTRTSMPPWGPPWPRGGRVTNKPKTLRARARALQRQMSVDQ